MINRFLFATPWWVNFLFFAPFLAAHMWRRRGLVISGRMLALSALFALAFGFVEAAVVVYLRAAVGILPGYGGTLAEVRQLSSGIYQQAQILADLPQGLFFVEFFREAATMIMLITVAIFAVRARRERWAVWLWMFAFWDISYYFWLWTLVHWPSSPFASDVLFLIPVPWVSQAWFPLLVSILVLLAVFTGWLRGAQ